MLVPLIHLFVVRTGVWCKQALGLIRVSRIAGQGLVVEPRGPGILVGDDCFLPVMIGHVVAGWWRWDAELREPPWARWRLLI